MQKVERRVKEYEIKVVNESRPGKKLLVLDVDYTFFGKLHYMTIMYSHHTCLLWPPKGNILGDHSRQGAFISRFFNTCFLIKGENTGGR